MTHFMRSNAINNCLNISFVDGRDIGRKVNDIDARDTNTHAHTGTHTHTHRKRQAKVAEIQFNSALSK